MSAYLHNTIPNLKPFDYERHHDSHFINQQWVLVNGISKKKAIYTFRDNNILEIERKDATITTSWTISIQNIFTIETEDGIITVKAYFKDDDILVLNHQDKEEFAMYINTTNYSEDLNSLEDIQDYLKDKYKKKVNKVIHKHEFYYISKSEEFGPCTVEELKEKVEKDDISAYCFVRDINEDNYAKRLRIIDLMQEL
ncbi:MAG: hypothetical protein CMC05_03215 [Flavobacteriaceae bacterium]|uniref:hypothetical protein n=1 Tax=Winogradskyella poriferorum TaxID=307627 RepID=UPI000C974830|nr:hypothetical protein [Flavobacteriaceae bacterium]|tara:strand:+ start:551 stop:1141 length:591 start_codon:yes stop_codon:yes gene_type:complete